MDSQPTADRNAPAGAFTGAHLAVVGAGLMGTQIACLLARLSGSPPPTVTVVSRRQSTLDASRRRAERYAAELTGNGVPGPDAAAVMGGRGVAGPDAAADIGGQRSAGPDAAADIGGRKGAGPDAPAEADDPSDAGRDAAALLGRLRYTTDLGAVAGASFVVESVVEDASVKQEVFRRLDQLLPAEVVLSSNTSALPVAECAGSGLRHPERVLISHFVQPAHIVPVVEVVLGPQTSAAAADRARALWRALGLIPVTMRRDEPGFLINRLQHALVREAVRLLAEGLASAEDIDAAVQYGLAPRFVTAGPLRQRDVNGLAMHVRVASRLWPELDTDNGAAVALGHLQRLVETGAVGLENGRGFYDWQGADPEAVRQTLDRQLAGLVAASRRLVPPWSGGSVGEPGDRQ
jgi:3-hydroxybutyryl-CoA dehydrogenase